jgi:putative ABC transport system permease protein
LLYFIRLGFKNVFRQRSRSALAMAAIGISVLVVLVGFTLAKGMENQIFSQLISESGELVVARQDFFEKSRFNPLKYFVRDARELRQKLLQVEGVKEAMLRIDFGLLVEKEGKTKGIRAIAVDVEPFAQRSTIPGSIVQGRYLKPDEKGMLLGKSVADELGLKVGDKVTVLGKTAYDSLNADDLELVGIFDLGTKAGNRATVIPLATAQEFLDMSDGVSKLLLFGGSYEEAPKLAERIQQSKLLPEGVTLRSWNQDPLLFTVHRGITGVRKAIVFIICFVAGLGILNMLMVSVLERRKEVGVMMALGMSRARIVGAFFYEALAYGALGSALGLLVGVPAALYLESAGLPLSTAQVQGMPVAFTRLYGDFTPDGAVGALLAGIILAILGMSLPVLKTFSMSPQDAMKRG